MHPYRPLHVATEHREECPSHPLAILLIVLGLLRVVPAVSVRDFDVEASIAGAMLAGGLALRVELPRRLARVFARYRRARDFAMALDCDSDHGMDSTM